MRCLDSKIAFTILVALPIWLFVVLPLIYLPKKAGMFLGLDNTAWTAFGAIAGWIYCGLTGGLLLFAVRQIRSAKTDAKITRTLAACDRYDTDPVLDRVINRLADALDDGSIAKTPKAFSVDMSGLFNYFESIAIGVSRGLYDKDIVSDQLKPIIIDHVDDLILSGLTGWKNPSEDFDHLMKLYREWKTSEGPLHTHDAQ
jgi:hypothetical protein